MALDAWRRRVRENRGFLLFLLGLGVLRTAVADWNPIPSGSMRPTLLEGDVVLVDRLAYDLKLPLADVILLHRDDPRRGDVVTFSSPTRGTRLIKRIVALPGDTVALTDDVLWINGEPARYDAAQSLREPLAAGLEVEALRATEHLAGHDRRVQFLPGVRARRDFGPLTVPAGHYFVLGDNRDNSEDSRFIGVVPRRLLIGRAHRVLVSVDLQAWARPRLARWVSPIR